MVWCKFRRGNVTFHIPSWGSCFMADAETHNLLLVGRNKTTENAQCSLCVLFISSDLRRELSLFCRAALAVQHVLDEGCHGFLYLHLQFIEIYVMPMYRHRISIGSLWYRAWACRRWRMATANTTDRLYKHAQENDVDGDQWWTKSKSRFASDDDWITCGDLILLPGHLIWKHEIWFGFDLNLLGFDYFEQIASFSNLYLKLLLKDIGRGKKNRCFMGIVPNRAAAAMIACMMCSTDNLAAFDLNY